MYDRHMKKLAFVLALSCCNPYTSNIPEPKQAENVRCWDFTTATYRNGDHDVKVRRCRDLMLGIEWDRVVK